MVDIFASIDRQRLSWYTQNQGLFCLAQFNNLKNTTMADPDNPDLNDIEAEVFSALCLTLVDPAIRSCAPMPGIVMAAAGKLQEP